MRHGPRPRVRFQLRCRSLILTQTAAHVSHNASDPFWPTLDGRFVFPDTLSHIPTDKGREIARAVSQIANGLRVFLRGSLLESPGPFDRADVDLIVVYEDRLQLIALQQTLPRGHEYDVRVLDERVRTHDPVDLALLHCRSLQLCGPILPRILITADKAFAWQHWLKYCPALIPGVLDTRARTSLIHFKLLARCFGVLSYLRHKRFTRDVATCVALARDERETLGNCLGAIREALERRHGTLHNIVDVKRYLYSAFDACFARW